MGPLGARQYEVLSNEFGRILDLNAEYTRFRQVKSAEELDWFRIGAYFADLGMAALRNHLRPGMSEIELGALIEQAYVRLGGGHAIHFVGTTPMEPPSVAVPRQYASRRRIEIGDAVSAEIGAAFWDHSGQVLRSFTIGKEPNALYRDLHQVADAAFDAVCAVLRPGALPEEVIAAAGGIEQAGFTIVDDLLHGYGGGYLPPIFGSKSRRGSLPDGALPGRPDCGSPAERGDPRPQGGCANGRIGGDHRVRPPADASVSAGIRKRRRLSIAMKASSQAEPCLWLQRREPKAASDSARPLVGRFADAGPITVARPTRGPPSAISKGGKRGRCGAAARQTLSGSRRWRSVAPRFERLFVKRSRV